MQHYHRCIILNGDYTIVSLRFYTHRYDFVNVFKCVKLSFNVYDQNKHRFFNKLYFLSRVVNNIMLLLYESFVVLLMYQQTETLCK